MNFATSLGILLVGVLVLGGCDTSINSSIVVPDGESRSGSLTSVNGDIELRDNSVVKGDIVIEDKMGVSTRSHPIEIEVTGGSIIEGDVVVKRNVDVRLILRDGGKVLGQIDGAEVIDENVAQPAVDDN